MQDLADSLSESASRFSLLGMTVLAGLGEALHRLRERSHLRQEELASKAGLTPAMLSRYERGSTSPHIASLEALLVALGADVHDLADALDEVNGRDPVDRTVAKAMAGGTSDAAVESLALHIAKLSERLAGALAELERVKGKPLTGTDSE
jgi:transcriptional regulator with XRE-family HTH domain